jgi:hypothetical protein
MQIKAQPRARILSLRSETESVWTERKMVDIITERLWRSLKQNEVYRNAYESPLDAFR